MIAYCGVYKALEDAGLIDCVTYTSALSGSSWYLATLYSHPDFPDEPKVSHKIIPEIRSCVEKYWQVHLSPPWSSKYLQKIITKSMRGQPVSFTDFYGYLVGQQLLKGRMKARLSDQADKIRNGQVPMPMYTCLHVKSNVSAKIFQVSLKHSADVFKRFKKRFHISGMVRIHSIRSWYSQIRSLFSHQ